MDSPPTANWLADSAGAEPWLVDVSGKLGY
jgi:hypothetical protein